MHKLVRFPFALPLVRPATVTFALASLQSFGLLGFGSAVATAQKAPIQIVADLTDAPRKVYHAEVDLPVTAGPLALTTPKWIPGNHRPTGPVDAISGVVFSIDGKTIPWRRDDVDLYQFHVEIPKGATTLHAHLDCIVTARVTQKIAVLEWEKLLLYPANTPVRDIAIQPSLKVPAGWGVGTALTPVGSGSYPMPAAGATTQFAVTNVEQLEDSPIIAGQYFHEFALAPEISPKHFIDVVSDSPEDSNLRPAFLADLNNLVREADKLYASHHYNVYHFLLTLSDIAGGEGLEHGQSSDNGVGEKGYADERHQLAEADLLPHEFTHSWNGKYRRPLGLYQTDFATMQQGALLWVYEGMTQYLGNMLASRSGIVTQAQYRDMLALTLADLDYRIGVTRTDQLAELSRSFNTMAGSLKRLLREQKEKERLQNEISIAQEVQANLFPLHARGIAKLDLHGICRPARSVSGDYYDFLVFHEEAHNGAVSRKETGVGIAIGDISGKGISAALLMATLHSAIRAYRFASEELVYSESTVAGLLASREGRGGDCDELFQSPGRILSLLNRHLYRSTQPEKYATLFLAHYDADSAKLTYSNAGQLPPLVLRPDGSIRRLDQGGTVVGLMDGMHYDEDSFHMQPGDILVAYSDGVTEPENDFGEFGEERMMEVVARYRDQPLHIISNQVMLALDAWIGAEEQPDDITLVLARQT